MQEKANVPFEELFADSPKPTSNPMRTVEVEISDLSFFADYATQFVKEAWRRNPLRMQQVNLTEQELVAYIRYLMAKRCECVEGVCRDYRRLKLLFMPSYVQWALALIGRVIVRKRGFTYVPVMGEGDIISYEDAFAISEKLSLLVDDFVIVRDAMPRSDMGDERVMTMAFIAGFVKGTMEDVHPAFSHCAAFCGLLLRDEVAFGGNYHVNYGEREAMRYAFISERGVLR